MERSLNSDAPPVRMQTSLRLGDILNERPQDSAGSFYASHSPPHHHLSASPPFGSQMNIPSSPSHRRNGGGHGSGSAIFAREPAQGTKSSWFSLPQLPLLMTDTSHVPCRFFMAGTCQAGTACPFSHTPESFKNPTPCKYFTKGNCKYGYRCANPHLLPDGSDARRRSQFRGDPRLSFPGPQESYEHHNGLGLMRDGHSEDLTNNYQTRMFNNMPSIASTYSQTPAFGSPSNEQRYAPTSPPIRALDATLPPTFDSNGTLNVFDGPFPASVPSRFGIGPSLATTSVANSAAFANLDVMARQNVGSNHLYSPHFGSSPGASNEHGFASKILHSDQLRHSDHIASSLPIPPRPGQNRSFGHEDEDDDLANYLPGSLSEDIMTPQEKMRRFSRDENGASVRHSLSTLASPPDSKIGSPSNASPSRWGPLFARKREENMGNEGHSSSPYGHVGSPLRGASALHSDMSPPSRPSGRGRLSGDTSPFGLASPADRRSSHTVGMLSQQLKSTRLRDSSATDAPAPTPWNGVNSTLGGRVDRTVSNASVGRSERIEEEQPIFVMDDEDVKRREQLEKAKQNDDNGGSRSGLGFRGTRNHSGPGATAE